MAGHSKWAQIKRKKEAKDKEKGKIFSKLSRLIVLAVKEGGGIDDPEKNVKLRLAIEKAKEYNMPKENILRAIERAKGSEGQGLQEIIYEGFAPFGVSLIILTATDNSKRTLSEIRRVLEEHGGKLGSMGSTQFLFQRCGLVIFSRQNSEEKIWQFAEKISALDIEEDKESFLVYIPFENIGRTKEFLGDLKPQSIEIDYRPLSTVKVEDKEKATQILKLIEALESLDDVQRVFANFDIPQNFLI